MTEKHPWDMTPQERFEASRRASDALDHWRDFSKTLLRDANGNLVQRERAPVVPGKIDDAAYERMTYSEKMAYAARAGGR